MTGFLEEGWDRQMLKKRLIPCIILKDGLLVQSIEFQRYLPIGKPKIAVEFFNAWDVDEIVILDISANSENRGPLFELIEHVSKICFVPLTVGGGIRTISDIRDILKVGADKVSINTEAIRRPVFITESADIFGSQCIVVSIDVKINSEGNYEVFSHCGKEPTGLHPIKWAQRAEEFGAGEIFLNSIDRDGTKKGYDLELIKMVSDAVRIPVIACGGVGKMDDFVEGITKGNASAVSAANIFQYYEHSTILAKAQLKKAGIDIRLSTEATYLNKL